MALGTSASAEHAAQYSQSSNGQGNNRYKTIEEFLPEAAACDRLPHPLNRVKGAKASLTRFFAQRISMPRKLPVGAPRKASSLAYQGQRC